MVLHDVLTLLPLGEEVVRFFLLGLLGFSAFAADVLLSALEEMLVLVIDGCIVALFLSGFRNRFLLGFRCAPRQSF